MTQFVAKDITGQRFGKQVAIKFVEKRNGHHYWEILCDCGRSSIKAKNSLPRTISCGKCIKRIDISGNRYNRLLVLEYSYSKKHKAYYKCQCDCGNITIMTGDSLTRGAVISCGCYKRDSYFKNIANQRFGKLITISPTDKRTGGYHVVWECICDCGNITYAGIGELKRGDKISCGCARTEGKPLFLYVFKSKLNGLIKIGTSSNVWNRKHEIEKYQKDSLDVLFYTKSARYKETEAHRQLKGYRAIHPNQPKGREWYYPVREVLTFVEELKRENSANVT